MNLRGLRYFCVVAELKSFSKAGRRLRVAQSAISRQVQNLETDLGLALFYRHGATIELTEAGAFLFRRSLSILQSLDETRSEILDYAERLAGQVCLGVPPAAGALIVPRLLHAVRERFPLVKLRIVEGIGEILMEKLQHGSISVALVYDPRTGADVIADPLLVERVHLFGLPGSLCSRPGKITIEDVVRLPLILHTKPHYIRNLLEDAAAEKGLALRAEYEVDSLSVIRSLVRQGAGYGVLTPAAAHGLAGEAKFASRPIMTPGMSLTLMIVRRSADERSALFNAISDLIKAQTRQIIDCGGWPSEPKFVAGEFGEP
jgi:LysR family transcriptional regulator, nitrogen assimilation regulatory protein